MKTSADALQDVDADERPADAGTDALIAELAAAGLVTIGFDAEGHETWTLIPESTLVGRLLAMSADGDALYGVLLGARERPQAVHAARITLLCAMGIWATYRSRRSCPGHEH